VKLLNSSTQPFNYTSRALLIKDSTGILFSEMEKLCTGALKRLWPTKLMLRR